DRPAVVLKGLTIGDFRAALQGSSWLATAGPAPLVLHDDRLYLYRLFQAEQRVKQHLTGMLSSAQPLSTNVAKTLEQLFPLQPQTEQNAPDWQRLACVLALQRRFAIITGGPGTGKTTTVVKLLALLQQGAALDLNTELNIKLAAPTGKAAVRLTESISGALSK